jgi:hypothetical protein
MVPLTSLWLPILVSGIFVFLASSFIHMALPYHRSDYGRVPSEDEVMAALRKFAIPPGDYFLPNAGSPAQMKTPEYKQKMKDGPVLLMTVLPADAYAMGRRLSQWFVYTLVISGLAGLVAGHAAGPAAPHHRIFHFAGITAFAAYALALPQSSIWYSRKWTTTLKSMFDGLIYAVVTAATFVWLWPR